MNELFVELKGNTFDISIRKPKNFTWVNTNQPNTEKTFFTDHEIPKNDTGIAWLVESPATSESVYNYDWIKNNHNRYKYVLTYSKELLSLGGNFLYYPFGNTLLSEHEFDLYTNDKCKLVSMMVSNKRFTIGHRFRHSCKDKILGMVDLFGNGVHNNYENKLLSCKNYYFQVVVENIKYDYYFSEKILDCFLSGVIPIYWGTNHVLDVFDKNGIITFNSENELIDIINSLTIDEYLKRIESVRYNFELSKQYSYSEDWIFNNYEFIF
jgi:hypothetical protein